MCYTYEIDSSNWMKMINVGAMSSEIINPATCLENQFHKYAIDSFSCTHLLQIFNRFGLCRGDMIYKHMNIL